MSDIEDIMKANQAMNDNAVTDKEELDKLLASFDRTVLREYFKEENPTTCGNCCNYDSTSLTSGYAFKDGNGSCWILHRDMDKDMSCKRWESDE